MASSILQVRIDNELRNESNEILSQLGLDMSSAVRLFLKRVVINQGLPFPMVVNKEENNFDPIACLESYLEN